uniref:Kinesin motor domain-containing protein n=1 Tax=Eptatretus burgeri TaxID=7764 RepID=A0A8C4NPF3_EPTBU
MIPIIYAFHYQVKVMLRVFAAPSEVSDSGTILKVDSRRKQVTLFDAAGSGSNSRHASLAMPRVFPVDAAFPHDASQAEVCAGTVPEVIQSVVNGADGCIFPFGSLRLGKTYTMIGLDSSRQTLGAAPCAIAWLFRLMDERKERTGARYSVRVSALELYGRDESLSDLLSEVASGNLPDESQSPGVFLREDPVCGTQLQNQCEIRAPTAEHAAWLLDAALAARRGGAPDCTEDEHRNSHMLFTLHLYQYRMERSGRGGMTGGRSRLHLLDLGSCEKVLCRSQEAGAGLCLSLTALGNVLLALANGSKHVPYRESKLSMLLRESLGNINCRTTMVAHVSATASRYTETMATVQLAARIHRLRKRKSRSASSSSGGESSCEESRNRRPPSSLRPFQSRLAGPEPEVLAPRLGNEAECSSSSEQSCDTVVYIGKSGDLTDNEGPPDAVSVSPASSSSAASLVEEQVPLLSQESSETSPTSPDLTCWSQDQQEPLLRPPDRDYFKCSTFAELQERLECIDGSEEPENFTPQVSLAKSTSPEHSVSKEQPDGQACEIYSQTMKKLAENTLSEFSITEKPDNVSTVDRPDSAMDISADMINGNEVISPTKSMVIRRGEVPGLRSTPSDKEIQKGILPPVMELKVKEFAYKRQLPIPTLPSPPPPPPEKEERQSNTDIGFLETRTSPVGMSPRIAKRGLPPKFQVEANSEPIIIRSENGLSKVTSQTLETSKEDEIIVALVRELSRGSLRSSDDNGNRRRPISIVRFTSDCSNQAVAPGSRPMSIINSVSIDFDPYTLGSPPANNSESQVIHGVPVAFTSPLVHEEAFDLSEGFSDSRRSSISSWLSEASNTGSHGSEGEQLCDSFVIRTTMTKSTNQDLGENLSIHTNHDSKSEDNFSPEVSMASQNGFYQHSGFKGTADTMAVQNIELNGIIWTGLSSDAVKKAREKSDDIRKANIEEDLAHFSIDCSHTRNNKLVVYGNLKDISSIGNQLTISNNIENQTKKIDDQDKITERTDKGMVAETRSVSLPPFIKTTISVHPKIALKLAGSLQSQNNLHVKSKTTPSDPKSKLNSSTTGQKSEESPWIVRESCAKNDHQGGTERVESKSKNEIAPAIQMGLNEGDSFQTATVQRIVDGCEVSTAALLKVGSLYNPESCKNALTGCSNTLPRRAASCIMKSGGERVKSVEASSDISEYPCPLQTNTIDRRRALHSSTGVFLLSRPRSSTPPAPPVRKSSLDQKNRVSTSAMSSGLLPNRACDRNISNQSNGKSDTVSHVEIKPGLLPKNDVADKVSSKKYMTEASTSVGMNGIPAGKPTRQASKGSNFSMHSSASESSGKFVESNKGMQLVKPRGHCGAAAAGKAMNLSMSSSANSKTLPHPGTTRGSSGSGGLRAATLSRSVQALRGKLGRVALEGAKIAGRASHSRVTELSGASKSGSSGNINSGRGRITHGDSDSGNDSGVQLADEKLGPALPSPYSKVTAPRRPQRRSSGHGSDNSSVLSGELPPAMGRTALLLYCQRGGSGQTKMATSSTTASSTGLSPVINNETTTMITSSNCSSNELEIGLERESGDGNINPASATILSAISQEILSENLQNSGGQSCRSLKSLKKRVLLGSQRRRGSTHSQGSTPEGPSPVRKPQNPPPRRSDMRPVPRPLNEPFEIKVYAIDDVPPAQKQQSGNGREGLVYLTAALRAAEERQRRLTEAQGRYQALCGEMDVTKRHLMLEPEKWAREFELNPGTNRDSPEFLELLESVTSRLEQRLNLCKARIMIVTCFDTAC